MNPVSLLPVVFVGLPGCGKTSVSRILAQRWNVPFVDTDQLIEERTGRTISSIFDEEGEAAFRSYEAQAVAEALCTPAIIALGGGALTHPRTRELLVGRNVIHLDAKIPELVRRLSRSHERPLLRNTPGDTLRALAAQRMPTFEQARTHRISSDFSPVETVCDRVEIALGIPSRIGVNGEHPYEIIIGTTDVAAEISTCLPPSAQRLLVVHPASLSRYVSHLNMDLTNRGFHVLPMCHPDGEKAKTVDVLAQGWNAASEAGISRQDAIISVGGGATTDLAGFIAATWLRGVAVVHVPSTVLAMVDAAIGGKTGINTPAGKNLAGAFHPPHGVIEDLTLLASLPTDEHRSGLAEVVKCGFIADPEILEAAINHPQDLFDSSSPRLRDVMLRAARVKADVVSKDLKETGLREILNYGHTLAHAIEKAEDYLWRHGEAVAVGCIFAAELACVRGMLTDEDVDTHRRALEALALPTTYSGAPFDALVNIMMSDKKVRSGKLRFVLLNGMYQPGTFEVSWDELQFVAQKMGIV